MPSDPQTEAHFDAALRAGAFHDPHTMGRLVDRLVRGGKIDLALELLDLAQADPRLQKQWKRISDTREELLDMKIPRD